ncbi:MAG: type III pantothenate kinase [Caldilineales bacterium]|nr:type III pantothenate kinase [Caldilineales bacterium]
MLLCVDIANTTISLGLFEGQTLRTTWRLSTDVSRTEDEYVLQLLALLQGQGLQSADLEGIVLACVVPALTGVWKRAGKNLLGVDPLVVGAGVKTGLSIRTEAPRQLGADRVANAVAAKELFGGPACIVDSGTALTFDGISASGEYLGHAMAPGLDLAVAALSKAAAQLPDVALAHPTRAIGHNTVESMQAGLVFGYVGLVEGLVARFRQELGPDMRVIATGRQVDLIAAETDVIDFVEPALTLQGLRLIWEMNQ